VVSYEIDAASDDEFSEDQLKLPNRGRTCYDHEISFSRWNSVGGPVYPSPELVNTSKFSLALMQDDCPPGFIRTATWSIPSALPFPFVPILPSNNIWMRSWSNGTCFMDTWRYGIHIDPSTGEIKDF
jgi:hypothetical protein